MTIVTHRGLAPTRQVLDNGAVIIVKESRATPAVTISAAIQAGSIFESDSQLGLAHFLSRVIDWGTTNRSAEEIAEDLDFRGVTVSVHTTRHVQIVSCTCLVEDFAAILQTVGEIVTAPSIPLEEVDKRRVEVMTAIRQDEDNPAVVAVERLFTLLYPNGHPYGRPSKGSLETVERLDRQALQKFHEARFAPSVLSLVIVGDVVSSEAVDAAAKVFGNWPAAPPDRVTLASPPGSATRRQSVITMMNKSQADIAYGFTTITRSDPRYDAFTLMNNALGQYALGGRLGESIRERQGMVYSFSARSMGMSSRVP